jgi:hypothetical protein
MMRKLRSFIVLLAFALFVQNTCPHGFAGKTVVGTTCGHCPVKHACSASPDGQKGSVSSKPAGHFPLFIFAVQKQVPVFQLEPVAAPRTALANSYEDILPDELLRPPRA